MKKAGLSILFFGIILTYCSGQENDNQRLDSIFLASSMPSPSKLMWMNDCDNAQVLAAQDIQKDSVYILIVGGEVPVVYGNDGDFEKRYAITYFDYGCVAADSKCMLLYDFLVFDFLNEKFGKKWKKEIRKDVYGLKEWKKNKYHIKNK